MKSDLGVDAAARLIALRSQNEEEFDPRGGWLSRITDMGIYRAD